MEIGEIVYIRIGPNLIHVSETSPSCDPLRRRHCAMSQDCAGGELAVKTAHIGRVPHEIRTSFPTLTALAHANAGSWLDFPDQDISKGEFLDFCVKVTVPQY